MIFFVGRVGNILQSLRSSASLVFVAWVKDFFLSLTVLFYSFQFILSSLFFPVLSYVFLEQVGEKREERFLIP